MSLLNNINEPKNLEKEKDTLGGFSLLPTDVYDAEIKLAYLIKAQSGALGLAVHFDVNGTDIRQTEYFQSGDDKGNKTTFSKNGEDFPLPGYTFSNNLCLLTVGKGLAALAGETVPKTVNIYNFKEQKEMPTEVEVVEPLLGKKIALAIEHQIVNKQEKGDNGYQNTNEQRELNTISHMFHINDRRTAPEMRNNMEAAEFVTLWLEKNQGNVIDKFKAVAGGAQSGTPGNKPSSGSSPNQSATDSVFGQSAG